VKMVCSRLQHSIQSSKLPFIFPPWWIFRDISNKSCNLCGLTHVWRFDGCDNLSKVPFINIFTNQNMLAQELFVGSLMKWVSMAEQPHTSLRSPCAMPSAGWSGVKLAAIASWNSRNAFSGVMNHTSPSGSLSVKSGFGGCQVTLPAQMNSANCNVRWRRNNGLGLFFMVRAKPLSSSEGRS
jgi:hypothetical protein